MVSCECWVVVGEFLSWERREASVAALGTLPGGWASVWEVAHAVLRTLECSFPRVLMHR